MRLILFGDNANWAFRDYSVTKLSSRWYLSDHMWIAVTGAKTEFRNRRESSKVIYEPWVIPLRTRNASRLSHFSPCHGGGFVNRAGISSIARFDSLSIAVLWKLSWRMLPPQAAAFMRTCECFVIIHHHWEFRIARFERSHRGSIYRFEKWFQSRIIMISASEAPLSDAASVQLNFAVVSLELFALMHHEQSVASPLTRATETRCVIIQLSRMDWSSNGNAAT